ncbi:MAG: hypothetical protein LKJ17_05440 [Oscillospiraceae bacterium]|jgi:hypothetical protein|nr:hypothetical protein [Oscillospiraceae bacterium]
MPANQNRDSQNFQSLQSDAVRRAREMQARAHLPHNGPSAPSVAYPPPVPGNRAFSTQIPAEPPAPPPEEEPPADPGSGLLDALLKDNERTLIWVLLLILLEEKADTALIFALMYLAT